MVDTRTVIKASDRYVNMFTGSPPWPSGGRTSMALDALDAARRFLITLRANVSVYFPFLVYYRITYYRSSIGGYD